MTMLNMIVVIIVITSDEWVSAYTTDIFLKGVRASENKNTMFCKCAFFYSVRMPTVNDSKLGYHKWGTKEQGP